MTAEGLPTLLPQVKFKHQEDSNDEVRYNPITINNLIDATKEKDHFNLNKITKVEVNRSMNSFTFEDGQIHNTSDPYAFHYSINGNDWIGYNNRDEVNLPENTCITYFGLPGHLLTSPGTILTYNMKVMNIDTLSTPKEGTPDEIIEWIDAE